jgi:hypothetical protein
MSDDEVNSLHYHHNNRIISRERLDDDWAPQTSAHHIAMMEQKWGQVKDTSHVSDGEESTASDVESDDEISPRDDRAI